MAALALLGSLANTATGQEWEPVTAELIRQEKPGYGKLCGVLVDPASGDVYIDLSDRGIYRSTDQGKSWKRTSEQLLRGRTEWPGCMMLDPLGRSPKVLIVALVYGSPIVLSLDAGRSWHAMDAKSSHVDWFAVDWSDPARRFVLALKHESGGLLIASHDAGASFTEVGKGYGPAWIFDEQTAVVAEAKSGSKPNPGLSRTTDGGKSFQPCGAYHARALPRWFQDALYWVVEGALIRTTDQGASWEKVCDLKDGRFGPVFGKDAKHLFVRTGKGIVESTDGGRTWGQAIALPREVADGSPLTWIAYDPVHNILYSMRMGSELYRLRR
jgi:photosystem II stability/assembly factor-like uncharacterized protein